MELGFWNPDIAERLPLMIERAEGNIHTSLQKIPHHCDEIGSVEPLAGVDEAAQIHV